MPNDDRLQEKRLTLGLNRHGLWIYCLFDRSERFCTGPRTQKALDRQKAEWAARGPRFSFTPSHVCRRDRGQHASAPLRKYVEPCPDCGTKAKRAPRVWDTACTVGAFMAMLAEHSGEDVADPEIEAAFGAMRRWAEDATAGAVNCFYDVQWCIAVDQANGDPDGLLDQNEGYEEWERAEEQARSA